MPETIRVGTREVPKNDLIIALIIAPAALAATAFIALAVKGWLDFPGFHPWLLVFSILGAVYVAEYGGIAVFTGGVFRWLARTPVTAGFAFMLFAGAFDMWTIGLIGLLCGFLVSMAFRVDWNKSLANDPSHPPTVPSAQPKAAAREDSPSFPGYGRADQSVIPEKSPYFKGWERRQDAGDDIVDLDELQPPHTD